MAKRARLATLLKVYIVHDSCFGAAVLNGTESKRLRRSSARHTDQIERQNWPLSRGLGRLGSRCSGRCRCREVAVVERVKQESMYRLSAGPKKVAVVVKWSFVEVRLCYWGKPLNISHRKKI